MKREGKGPNKIFTSLCQVSLTKNDPYVLVFLLSLNIH